MHACTDTVVAQQPELINGSKQQHVYIDHYAYKSGRGLTLFSYKSQVYEGDKLTAAIYHFIVPRSLPPHSDSITAC